MHQFPGSSSPPMMKVLRQIALPLGLIVLIPALFSNVLVRYSIDRFELLFVTPSTFSSNYLRSVTHDKVTTTATAKLHLLEHEIHPCDRGSLGERDQSSCDVNLQYIHGIYVHDKHDKAFHQIHSYYENQNKTSSRLLLANFLQDAWSKNPSAASIAQSLLSPIRETFIDINRKVPRNQFYHDVDRWCFQPYHPYQSVCTAHSRTMENNSIYLQGHVPLFLTSDFNVSIGHVFLSFPAAHRKDMIPRASSVWNLWDSSEFVGTSGIRKNPNRNNKKDTTTNHATIFDRFLLHPTTFLLLLVNVAFAFLLFYKQVYPENVSMSYGAIINRHEYWRCWSGSLAHFQPWHLLFNMSSLYSLGINLENDLQFTSISFLCINIALMLWTTLVEMGLLYGRIRWIQRNHPEDSIVIIPEVKLRQSVGFSGVLFAWMVVDCLERSQTCPVPFLPTACFSTHSLAGGWIKFNAGPFVSLIVCQFLIPRASFMGHFSGILCGFILHWKILPTNLAWSPEVLIPLFLLLDWWLIRNKLGFQCESVDRASAWGNVYSANHDDKFQMKQSTLEYGKGIMVISCCLCFISFNVLGTIALSQCVVTVMFHFITDMHNKSYRLHDASIRSRFGVVYRGFVVSMTISIVSNALSIGSIVGAWVHFQFEYNLIFGPTVSVLIILSLILINYASLVLICGILHDGHEPSSDTFSFIYGWLMKNSHNAMEVICDRALRNQRVIQIR